MWPRRLDRPAPLYLAGPAMGQLELVLLPADQVSYLCLLRGNQIPPVPLDTTQYTCGLPNPLPLQEVSEVMTPQSHRVTHSRRMTIYYCPYSILGT